MRMKRIAAAMALGMGLALFFPGSVMETWAREAVLAVSPGEPEVVLEEKVPVMVTIAGHTEAESLSLLGTGEEDLMVNRLDARDGLQRIFDAIRSYHEAHPGDGGHCTVTLPDAVFQLKPTQTEGSLNCLCLFADTTLDLSAGTTLVRDATQTKNVMLRFGDGRETTGEEVHDIRIIGGTFDGGRIDNGYVRFTHGHNILIRDTTFTGGYDCHYVEFAGSDGVEINSCRFLDCQATKSSTNREVIQLEVMNESTFSGYPPYDHVQSRNVLITNCVFEDVKSGLGTHAIDVGTYYDNIRIINNSFKNTKHYAIACLGWKNSTISGNTITDCGSGIRFNNMIESHNQNIYNQENAGAIEKSVNSVIQGNQIRVTDNGWTAKNPFGIEVFGEELTGDETTHIPAGDYRVSGITISGNKVTTATTTRGIRLTGVLSAKVASNEIATTVASDSAGVGIWAEKAGSLAVSGSKITGASVGIQVADTKGGSLKSNTVAKAGTSGIFLGGTTLSDITGNSITAPGDHGIALQNASVVTNIKSNTIKTPGIHGIQITGKSKAVNTSANAITSAGHSAIRISTNGIATNIKGNKLSGQKSYGIYFSGGASGTLVSGNTITGGKYGYRSQTAKVKTVQKNRITKAVTYGIRYIKSYYKTKMTGNLLKGCGHNNKIKTK